MSSLVKIDKTNIPSHVAIIMDGNGRWAKNKGEERIFGHTYGVESVREVLKAAKEIGVKYLTLYAFSAENWSRPKSEVEGLMDLLVQSITGELDEMNKNGVRLLSVGNTNQLPEKCRKSLANAELETKNNSDLNLVLALNYSAREDIIEGVKKISKDLANNNISEQDITPDLFNNYLSTSEIPSPELLIRTSGEIRISNFLLWEIAYTELYFTDVFWPDFKREDFLSAIVEYQNRERRFGMVSEQI